MAEDLVAEEAVGEEELLGEEGVLDELLAQEGAEEELAVDEEAVAEEGEPVEEGEPLEEGEPAEEGEGEPAEDMLAQDDSGEGDDAPAVVDEAAEAEAAPVDDDQEGVQEHLKDAVDGVLRLKRLLSRDGGDDPADKKNKLNSGEAGTRPIVQAKINMLLSRWGVPNDLVMIHSLEYFSVDELQMLIQTNYRPDFSPNAKRYPCEQVNYQILQRRERELTPAGGSQVDVIAAFKHRWKLDLQIDRKLRALTHKDLRYVMKEYNGDTSVDELIAQAASEQPDEEGPEGAALERPGLKTLSRFNRLELIDPLADAAVFGDANLTFSKLIAAHRKGHGHVGRVIATTFEEIDTLRERYPEIDESIKILEDHDAEVYHGVDCTRIAVDDRFQGMEGRLGAVYYNFPHSGAIKGFFDSHPMVNWRHENLMRLFFRALRFFVKPGGIVKVSSNGNATGVRFSYIVGGAIENEFNHTESMPFTEWALHRYGRSYGDKRDVYKRPDAKNNQSYNAQRGNSDMVYCFTYAPTGKKMGKQQIAMPPTLKCLSSCKEGPFKTLHGPAAAANLAKQLHSRFMVEIAGTHVG